MVVAGAVTRRRRRMSAISCSLRHEPQKTPTRCARRALFSFRKDGRIIVSSSCPPAHIANKVNLGISSCRCPVSGLRYRRTSVSSSSASPPPFTDENWRHGNYSRRRRRRTLAAPPRRAANHLAVTTAATATPRHMRIGAARAAAARGREHMARAPRTRRRADGARTGGAGSHIRGRTKARHRSSTTAVTTARCCRAFAAFPRADEMAVRAPPTFQRGGLPTRWYTAEEMNMPARLYGFYPAAPPYAWDGTTERTRTEPPSRRERHRPRSARFAG